MSANPPLPTEPSPWLDFWRAIRRAAAKLDALEAERAAEQAEAQK